MAYGTAVAVALSTTEKFKLTTFGKTNRKLLAGKMLLYTLIVLFSLIVKLANVLKQAGNTFDCVRLKLSDEIVKVLQRVPYPPLAIHKLPEPGDATKENVPVAESTVGMTVELEPLAT